MHMQNVFTQCPDIIQDIDTIIVISETQNAEN